MDSLTGQPLMDVFLREKERLVRIAAGLGVVGSDIDDVLQEVSIKAMKMDGQKMSQSDAVGWLVRVTINMSLLEHRKRKRFVKFMGRFVGRGGRASQGDIGPDKEMAAKEERAAVRQVLRKVDKRLLGPLVLRYFCDYNSTEIAEMLEVKAVTVRSRLREGRMVLAKELKKKGVTE